MFLDRSNVGAVCAERCMHGSQGGVARESPLYPTEQANHPLETISTGWFGTSMLGATRWCKSRDRCCRETAVIVFVLLLLITNFSDG